MDTKVASGTPILHDVDVNLDVNLDQLAEKRALSAPSGRSILPVLSEPVVRRLPVVVGFGACSSSEVALAPLAFYIAQTLGRTSVLWIRNNERIHLRLLDNQWVSAKLVSHEWSAWCGPSVRRPRARSPSIDVTFPNDGRCDVSTDVRPWSFRIIGYDGVLYHYFNYPSNGAGLLPIGTLLFNKFVGGINACFLWDVRIPLWAPPRGPNPHA